MTFVDDGCPLCGGYMDSKGHLGGARWMACRECGACYDVEGSDYPDRISKT